MPGAAAQQPSPNAPTDEAQAPEEAPAVQLEVAYTGDVVANLRGGNTRDVVYLDNVDVTAALDLERLLGWKRTSLFLHGLGNQGGQPSAMVGDVQGTNNIETDNAWRIYEAFVEHRLLAERLSLLAGLYDLNSEFDVLEPAGVFINSSFGIGPEFALSRAQGPSIFPFTALGVRARALPHDRWYVQAAVLDGVPGDPADPRASPFHFDANDGLLLVAETGWLVTHRAQRQADERELLRKRRISRLDAPPHRGKFGVGLWYYTARFDGIAPTIGPQRGNLGGYVHGQWQVYHAPGDPDQGLHAFARLGMASDEINRIAAYTGGGFVFTGVLPGREADQLGLGVAVAHNGAAFKRAQRQAGTPVAPAEIALEATYSASFLSWLTVQGDVQYVRHPDTNPALRDALVTALRVQITP